MDAKLGLRTNFKGLDMPRHPWSSLSWHLQHSTARVTSIKLGVGQLVSGKAKKCSYLDPKKNKANSLGLVGG